MRTFTLCLLLAATVALADDPAPAAAPAAPVVAPAPQPGFDFLNGRIEVGSYGRAMVGTDLTGRLGRSANVVSHGPRLLEDPYAELEVRREDTFGPVKSRVVATVAFFAPFFHFTGDVSQHIALRNLYAQGTIGGLTLWGGSRMYRGDDVYLLNFWPLDDLNTVGGGASYRFETGTELRAHVGLQRLDQPSQSQAVLADNPLGFGTVSVARLDRPRLIGSLKATQEWKVGEGGVRASLYGEVHQMGAGVSRNTVTGDETVLPADGGGLFGAQLTGWMPQGRFVHVWARYAAGLGVYDELTTPSTFANDRTTRGANSLRFAAAAGWDSSLLGVVLGAYVDLVRDAGPSTSTAQKYDEGAIAARGQWYASKWFGVALEASYQRRVYSLVDPTTGQLRSGGVTQLGVMPYFSPLGQGLFARPQLRLVYSLSLRDAGARSFYPADDVASQRTVEHYLGVSIEWWFNSSTYPVR
ncbi:MAG: carbohydrate porin [Myxococcaceae bacterium]